MKIGELIKTARKTAGFTQASLAKELKVTQASLSAWERGVNNPSFVNVRLISNITKAPLEQLKNALLHTRMNNMEHGKPQAAQVKKDHLQIDLRDYFAAKAMQALIAVAGWEGTSVETISGCAYEQADAMIAERNKGEEE